MAEASIIVATHNRADILPRALDAMRAQEFGKAFEIIVVDDGSTDETPKLLEAYCKKHSNVRFFRQDKPFGPATARNRGIAASSGKYIVIMDDDCIPEADWLSYILSPFAKDETLGASSTFSYWGGTSTAYRRRVLEEIHFFDTSFPKNYREDTDTIFKILDKGYTVKLLEKDKFHHEHPPPKGPLNKLRFAWGRIKVHSVDPLLYKKHHTRTKKFLDIKLGFIRNPWKDFEVATGLWWKKSLDFKLASPQGVTLVENKTPLHALVIILGGVAYAVLLKLVRLYGSLKYGKLLV